MHLLADIILIVHFAFVVFVVGGLVAIWTGAAAGWDWVRNFRFRAAHLAAICIVAGEALLGITCPLTEWEDALRGHDVKLSFVARWVHRMLYYSFPEWLFTVAYVLFALAVAATYVLVPPQRNKKARHTRP